MASAPVPDTSPAADDTAPVLLREIPTACGRRFGHATLNAPASLNALSLAMIEALGPRFDAWLADPDIVGIVLDGSGDRAFCAGGDIRELYRTMLDCGAGRNPYAERFFALEYRLDYRIHTSPKPVMVWGHGIVMGGGIGLFAGGSHRVVTPQTRLAMPEVAIGLFPDVGGSWILDRMPGHTGAFLALTGAPVNAADARYLGLADILLPHEARGAVLAQMAAARWDDGREASIRLDAILRDAAAAADPALATSLVSPVAAHRDRIDATMGHGDLRDIAPRLPALAEVDPWLAKAVAGFMSGSPTSAALGLLLQRHCRHRSLADVFRIEYNVALACAAGQEFREGVRALLIDKDRKPVWRPARLDDLDPAAVAAHLEPRQTGPHPLADLDQLPRRP